MSFDEVMRVRKKVLRDVKRGVMGKWEALELLKEASSLKKFRLEVYFGDDLYSFTGIGETMREAYRDATSGLREAVREEGVRIYGCTERETWKNFRAERRERVRATQGDNMKEVVAEDVLREYEEAYPDYFCELGGIDLRYRYRHYADIKVGRKVG